MSLPLMAFSGDRAFMLTAFHKASTCTFTQINQLLFALHGCVQINWWLDFRVESFGEQDANRPRNPRCDMFQKLQCFSVLLSLFSSLLSSPLFSSLLSALSPLFSSLL